MAEVSCENCGEDASLRHDLCILALEARDRRWAVTLLSKALEAALGDMEAADADLAEAVACVGELPTALRRHAA